MPGPYEDIARRLAVPHDTFAVAAAATAAAIKTTPGRLFKVIVTATGTAAISFYDNASAASGTTLLTIPANAATGTIYTIDMPFSNGLWVASGSNTPAITGSYN